MSGELTKTAFDAMLKEIYLGPVRKQFNVATPLLTLIRKDADSVDATGKQAIIPVRLSNAQGIGARADGEALPTQQTGVKLQQKVPVKHNYATFRVTGPTMRASRKDSGAFARAADDEMTDLTDAFLKDINRQINGDGLGIMGVIDSVSSQIITIYKQSDGIAYPGTQYIKRGQTLSVIDTDTTTVNCTDLIVTSVTDTTVTVTGAITADQGDFLVRKLSITDTDLATANHEILGIRAAVNDDTGTYLNLDRSTYSELKAKVYDDNDETSKIITLARVQEVLTYMEKAKKTNSPKVEIGKGKILYTTFEIRDKIAAILESDKRYMNTVDLPGGWTSVTYSGVPIVTDVDCYPGELFGLHLSDFAMYHLGEPSWADEDGSILKFVTGYDMYEGILYWDSELGCSRPNAQVKRKGIDIA